MRRVLKPFMRSFCMVVIVMIAAPSFSFAIKGKVAIIYSQQNKAFQFTANEMKKTLEQAGHIVMLSDIANLATIKADNRFILTVKGKAEAGKFLKKPNGSSLTAPGLQGYSLRNEIYVGYKDWYIIGGDARGVIYGGLDVSETVKLKGFEALTEVDKKPYITNRGIKFNIPLDARTPSYSDNADAAQQNIANMWDVNFWHEFLDEMAHDRFNMLSLWSLSPFPSLVDVPEYPNAGLQDVKKTTSKLLPSTDAWYMSTSTSLANLVTIKKITLAEKIAFWKDIMQYASDRGIDCYLFTWNLFVYGTESSGYGFTDKITDEKTKDYIRKATKALIKTYPLLKGIGLTAGENMYRQREVDKEKFLYESYGQGINDALETDTNRTFKLIHRAHQADINVIKTAFSGLSAKCTLDFSYKYSVAQMYSSIAPKYIYESQFLDHIGNSKFYLTVRDDAWYNIRGGSDPAFTRAYFKNIPKKNFEGFYVGPDGYTWGREYISKTPNSTNDLILKKRWYSFRLLGKLAYDPDIPDSHFTDLIADRFAGVNAKKLQAAWAKASQVMPWINRFHNGRSQNDFQWYPEGCTSFYGFRSIDNFISCAPQKGEGMLSIPEYTDAVLGNKTMAGITPVEVAMNLQKTAEEALALIAGMTAGKDRELNETIGDIKAMSYLGQYYSKKILGATYKHLRDNVSQQMQKVTYRNLAIKSLQEASLQWRKYAAQITSSYIPQHLTRMHFTIDFKAMQAHVDKEVTMVTAKLPAGWFDMKPPLQQLEVVFSNHSNYYFWHLDKLNLPANWSAYKSVVLEVYATSKQPFDFIIQTDRDTLVRKGNTPPAIGWTRITIPVEALKKQTARRKNASSIYREAANEIVPMNEVLGLGVSIEKPIGYPVLEIRSIKLSKEDPATAFSSIHR
jgi:hypothetical protein